MENQHTVESLKQMIAELEQRQVEEGELFKEQLDITIKNIKPANILKNIVKEFYSSENLMDEIINTAISVTSGFVTKKIVVGNSKNQILKLVGLAIQFGMTTLISKKFHVLKDKLNQLISRFLEEKEEKDETEVKEVKEESL